MAARSRRALAAVVGVGAAMAGGLQHSVWAKPRDTPDYLMPFYLTTLRRRFNHYATEDKNGKRHMSTEDFIRSVLCATDVRQEFPVQVARDLDSLFRLVDSNSDGLLSFAEYSMFMLFLTNGRKRFELAFKMFDRNESGTVDVEEFTDIVKALNNDPTVRFCFKGGITQNFFGETYDNKLTLEEFWSFVITLRGAVWRAEFNQYDPTLSGKILPEEFGKLITASMLGSHLPYYIVDNMRKIRAGRVKTEVDYETWDSFNRLMLNSREVGRAIQTYTAAGVPLGKEDFVRAVEVSVPDTFQEDSLKKNVDLIYAIFDRDGDGHLEYDEFLSVARCKYNFNSRNKSDEGQQSLPVFKLFSQCLQRAWRDGEMAAYA
ncbi:hypothetical protein DIPPA_17095 [Diplonema papillatum]|nr:hypothetical protein DIPPA_17095 [Diplonema papillatum]